MTSIALKNSECLLSDYPFLNEQPEWKAFVQEYDKPACCKRRLAARTSYQLKQSEAVSKLEDYCRLILKQAFFGKRQGDGSWISLTREEMARERMNAAVELAKSVEILLSPSKEGKTLRNAVRAEADRREVPRNRQDKADASAVVCFAFLKFLHREERLPSKKELNVEANRLAKCEVGGTGKRKFGEVFQRGGNRWLVYDNISTFHFNRDVGTDIGWEFRVVPSEDWNKLKWENSSGLAEYTTPLGLKRLPEAHEDKGKKGRKKT